MLKLFQRTAIVLSLEFQGMKLMRGDMGKSAIKELARRLTLPFS